MNFTEHATNIIKRFEGLRLIPYLDGNGNWTVGYGHRLTGDAPHTPITQTQADILLDRDVTWTAIAIHGCVTVPLTQNQFDALTSFVFNVGSGAFKSSHLRELLNDGQYDAAASQFLVWDHIDNKVSEGLLRRRQAEHDLFVSNGNQ